MKVEETTEVVSNGMGGPRKTKYVRIENVNERKKKKKKIIEKY